MCAWPSCDCHYGCGCEHAAVHVLRTPDIPCHGRCDDHVFIILKVVMVLWFAWSAFSVVGFKLSDLLPMKEMNMFILTRGILKMELLTARHIQ